MLVRGVVLIVKDVLVIANIVPIVDDHAMRLHIMALVDEVVSLLGCTPDQTLLLALFFRELILHLLDLML